MKTILIKDLAATEALDPAALRSVRGGFAQGGCVQTPFPWIPQVPDMPELPDWMDVPTFPWTPTPMDGPMPVDPGPA